MGDVAAAAPNTLTVPVSARLKRLSTADPNAMTIIPSESFVVSQGTTVAELVARLYSRASSLDVAPAQDVYLIYRGAVVEPQRSALTMQQLNVSDDATLLFTAPYLTYSSSLEHAVLKLPRPKPTGQQLLLTGSC